MSGVSLLRLVTCGAVDDGKSTLIGRLLHDLGAVSEDQLDVVTAESRTIGTRGGELDFALLVDGLMSEREQGITIDVAHRYFATAKRKFIVADSPGHVQYTRNMVTAASNADVAILVVDARKGLITQSRRHTYIASLLGIRHIVVVVTKMDMVSYDEAAFARIVTDFRSFARSLAFAQIDAIPVSGVTGDNIVARGKPPWYRGPTLIEVLERAQPKEESQAERPFQMAVQSVIRPDQDFRGFAGRISSGVVKPGDSVRILPSGHAGAIARIVTMDGDLTRAEAGRAVTLTLDRELDCSRGDVIAAADAPSEVADQFQATLIWMNDAPLYPGRRYWMKIGANTVTATITRLDHAVDIDTLQERPIKQLDCNAVGVGNISLDRMIAFEPFDQNRDLGGFILIDRDSCETVGAGLIRFALRRSQNIHWQALEVDAAAHAAMKGHGPAIFWFTGLSGAGKSTIANLVEKQLHALGLHTMLLDGDNLRHGINKDLGFTQADRIENIRRAAEVAKLMADAGLVVLVALISPFRQERALARAIAKDVPFHEVFIDVPLDVAESRDPKGLYKKARAGALKNFTGIDSPYEAPEAAEIRVDAARTSAERAAEEIVKRVIAATRR